MSNIDAIHVSSHVSRDFLQNSAYFTTLPKVIWEYVSNSLDATKEGVSPRVVVEISSHGISISDNGKGMSRDELRNFFQMHGENIQRKKGKFVRGRFGTGKSAAFGIAHKLTIDTVQNNLRNVVSLSRKSIEQAQTGESFPVSNIVVNQQTSDEDGTIISIEDLINKKNDINNVIQTIERHLTRFKVRGNVSINGHECKSVELPFTQAFSINSPEDIRDLVGDVILIIKVSATPLEEENNGIDILSHGVWHTTTLAGQDKKERSNYIFGEIDVPVLEDNEFPIPPFDNTRNNTLNPQNPVVVVLLGWINEEIDKVRTMLVEVERTRKKSEQAKQLEREARKIAEILNQDFEKLEIEFELNRIVAKRSGNSRMSEVNDNNGQLSPGDGDIPTELQQTGSPHGNGKSGNQTAPGDVPRPGPTVMPGNELGERKSRMDGNKKLRRGGFTIDYRTEGVDSPRSRYESDSKNIVINLDHPQIAYALKAGGNSTNDPNFRQICYEIAAIEYAIAIPYEKIERDELYDASEALFDVKDTINRLTRKLAQSIYED